jgi:putative oxidoreductase
LAIVVELVGGIALVLGWRVRLNAFLLGGYSLLTGVLFHSPIGDPMGWLEFLKNVALAGGCLLLTANGAVSRVQATVRVGWHGAGPERRPRDTQGGHLPRA